MIVHMRRPTRWRDVANEASRWHHSMLTGNGPAGPITAAYTGISGWHAAADSSGCAGRLRFAALAKEHPRRPDRFTTIICTKKDLQGNFPTPALSGSGGGDRHLASLPSGLSGRRHRATSPACLARHFQLSPKAGCHGAERPKPQSGTAVAPQQSRMSVNMRGTAVVTQPHWLGPEPSCRQVLDRSTVRRRRIHRRRRTH